MLLQLISRLCLRLRSDATRAQEFSIEIPDAEADEILTVQQGALPSILITPVTHDSFLQLLTTSRRRQKVKSLNRSRHANTTSFCPYSSLA